jgi:hypothetical protein
MPTTLDPFSAHIVELVRSMPDEAILDLVRARLGTGSAAGGFAGVSGAKRKRATRGGATGGAGTRRRGRRPRATSEERTAFLVAVERAVKSSKGVSTRDLAKTLGRPPLHVASAVRELKAAKRIYQGGDKRFARYAGDPKTAKQASLNARGR